MVCVICAGTAEAQSKSWIIITRETETVLIEVRYQETGLQSDRFTVEATKEGVSGTSISKQSGLLDGFAIGDVMSTSRISLEPGATLKVEFEMLRKDAVVYTELREVTGY
jgi:archaellum component FlaF (FlaF/FlaG flagellin family)